MGGGRGVSIQGSVTNIMRACSSADKDAHEHSYALVNPPSPAMEVSVGDVENMSMQSSSESQFPQNKNLLQIWSG